MTSNNQISLRTPPPETNESASPPSTVYIYVVSYNAKDWKNGVTHLDGTKPSNEFYGTVASYRSLSKVQALSKAQNGGLEWGLKQLQDRLDKHDPPLASEKDRDAAFDKWTKSESKERDVWSLRIGKGDETLVVKAEVDDGSQGLRSVHGGEGQSEMKG